MAKRFTETEKWKKEWYRKLGSNWRDIWQYLLDNCDHAGVWEISLENITHFTGQTITLDELIYKFGERIKIISDTKLHITTFIDFQYKGQLNPKNSVHYSVLKILSSNQIKWAPKPLPSPCLGATIGATIGATDKDKEKDQVMDKEKDQESAVDVNALIRGVIKKIQ